MSKTSLCIELLKILYSRNRVVGVKELSDILETNERNIPEYVRELREVGYNIKTVAGRYGGYVLERHSVFPAIKLTESEIEGFMSGYDYLRSRNDFMEKKSYDKAMVKICSAIINKDGNFNDTLITNRFPLAMSQDELEKRYLVLKDSINKHNAVKIWYVSLINEEIQRIIDPYKLFMYNNAWFVLGYDEDKGDIRYFKLNRINKFDVLNKKFHVLMSYNESDYLDEFGMKNNGEWYPVKLKLTGNYALLAKERIYGKDQSLECGDDYTILCCSMQNKENIKHFVLGLGEYCEVIEPQWLKDEILSTCNKLVYNNCGKGSYLNLLKVVPENKIRTIAVDFDGTLCERKKFPQIGEPKMKLIEWLIEQRKNGKKLILWTCREKENLLNAVNWCKGYGLVFDAVNKNLDTANIETTKVIADLYIDDRSCLPI